MPLVQRSQWQLIRNLLKKGRLTKWWNNYAVFSMLNRYIYFLSKSQLITRRSSYIITLHKINWLVSTPVNLSIDIYKKRIYIVHVIFQSGLWMEWYLADSSCFNLPTSRVATVGKPQGLSIMSRSNIKMFSASALIRLIFVP